MDRLKAATLYPDKAPANSPRSEIKVRENLAEVTGLVIFHSVAWQSRRSGKQGDGEADFVVLVPDLGIVILEVKGGEVETINGRWYSTGRDGVRHSIRNPFDQARDSKYALLNFFETVDSALKQYPIVHGVVFPDIEVNQLLAPNAPREIMIDRKDLKQPLASIRRIFRHWGQAKSVPERDVRKIVEFLAPTISVRRLLRDHVEEVDKALIDLTDEQMGVLQSIRRIKRAAILGSAGTGKTLLAVEKARQLSSCGFRTLLLCYNTCLKQHLSFVLYGTPIDVETFHSLVLRVAKSAGIKIPFDPDASWYETSAPELLRDASAISEIRYDAILVDESQDFATEWLSALQLLGVEQGIAYFFADSHQNLYRRGWSMPEGLVELELTLNCRNTRQIARRVAGIFGDQLEGRFVDGPEPKFLAIDRPRQLVSYIANLVETILVEEKVAPSHIVVLTNSTSVVSELRSMGVAGYLFTILGGHGIQVETIHRFKGLEREVVVVALSDNVTEEDLHAIAYVGLSRAKVGLYFLSSTKIKNAIAWA